MVEAVRYRVGQFLRALTAPHAISQEEIERASQVLTPEARELFLRQAPQDQRHALAVYSALRRSGYDSSHLLAAALLHDVGKAVVESDFYAELRAAFVLLDRFAPRMLEELVQEAESNEDWRRPLAIYARHPEIGARLAEEAGCSPLTVALIRRHEMPVTDCQDEEDRLLAALQEADNAN